jgi:hypothetical protein
VVAANLKRYALMDIDIELSRALGILDFPMVNDGQNAWIHDFKWYQR